MRSEGRKRKMDKVLCAAVILLGIFMLIVSFVAFVYRKITEGAGILWIFFSIILILLGAVPIVSGCRWEISSEAALELAIAGSFFILIFFYSSITISNLVKKNQELAMQVSLINQENEQFIEQLASIEEELEQLKQQSRTEAEEAEPNKS